MPEEYTIEEIKAKRKAFLDSIPDNKEMAWAEGWAKGFVAGVEAILRETEDEDTE